jgi:hypothetical protein
VYITQKVTGKSSLSLIKLEIINAILQAVHHFTVMSLLLVVLSKLIGPMGEQKGGVVAPGFFRTLIN